ncbi:MAG: type II toxin-antitoxin system VapC family toxin [Candidatus Limnocylindrales bacterium]
MRYVLDTTLLIDVAHGMPAAHTVFGALFDEPNDLYTCDVITAEALSGGSDEQRREIRGLLDALEYVSTIPDAARHAAETRRRRGQTSHRTLGDALIAGVAWSLGATVITRNAGDFIAQGIPVLTY